MFFLQEVKNPMSQSMRVTWTCLIAGLLFFMTVPLAAAEGGQQIFLDQKCNRCHSIASLEIEATIKSEKMKGPDLENVGSRHEAEWLSQWIKKEVSNDDGKNHSAKWAGSDKELEGLVAWLASLKSE